jgi:hypothetical protein
MQRMDELPEYPPRRFRYGQWPEPPDGEAFIECFNVPLTGADTDSPESSRG